jgi:hypothetical protein
MEPNKTSPSNSNEILHSGDQTKLTSTEIAKAVAHHNKRHSEDHIQSAQSKGMLSKKQSSDRPK